MMPETNAANQNPMFGNLRFENTRFYPDLTPFHQLAKDMVAQFGYSAKLSEDRSLLQFLRLRVAQLNPAPAGLILHAAVAASIGIPSEQVAHLASWRESSMFSPAERAALAYCEGLTSFSHVQVPALHDGLQLHFTTHEVAEIAAVIINMNVWTRLKLTQGAIPVAKAIQRIGSLTYSSVDWNGADQRPSEATVIPLHDCLYACLTYLTAGPFPAARASSRWRG